MRKVRKIIPITDGKQPTPPSRGIIREEFRLLTCRQTHDSVSFQLGPPLLRRSRPSNSQPGKILPFPLSPAPSRKK